jgi:CxxC motif-containing protein (DUF1111 family)
LLRFLALFPLLLAAIVPASVAADLPPVLELTEDDRFRPGVRNFAAEFNIWIWQDVGIVPSLDTLAPASLSGGATSISLTSREAFSAPISNLDPDRLRDFAFGRHLFRRNWVIAPATVAETDGLGPTFNRVSCSGCHLKDGRGQPPSGPDQPMKSMLIRLSVPGTGPHGGPVPHPVYGGQLQDKGILGVPKEGRATITHLPVDGLFGDGTRYRLREPVYAFDELGHGALGDEILFSPRVAPAVYGLGLLEAIDEDVITAAADPDDADGDGISGRVNRVWDPRTEEVALGRFGWKANTASVYTQVAGAALGDMGITSTVFPFENCPDAQSACAAAPDGGMPEIADADLRKLVLYTRALAVPTRRDVHDPAVVRGEALFEAAGCAGCHTPTLVTGEHSALPEFANQTIHPYTDLLLHDMGEGLADGRPDFQASGREWRTAPLWGIGLIQRVNLHRFLLHDGRADGLMEAILWHGGEARAARDEVLAMPKVDRDALVAFLSSL